MPAGAVAVLIILIVFLGIVSIIGIMSWHKQELEKIRVRKQGEGTVQMSDELRAELNALKEQVLALRDTTTKFDLSFDSALDGVEQRLKRVEERQLTQTYQTSDETLKQAVGR